MTRIDGDSAHLRRALADSLVERGVLRTEPWREAVEAVPREAFLRGGWFDAVPGSAPTAWRPVMPGSPDWLEQCYRDESLVTQVAGTIVPGDLRGEIMRTPTSSSTMPNLLVRMWEDLQVEDGHRVLEAGTGTGYSTALGCHRLGEDQIVSMRRHARSSTRVTGRRELHDLGSRARLLYTRRFAPAYDHQPSPMK